MSKNPYAEERRIRLIAVNGDGTETPIDVAKLLEAGALDTALALLHEAESHIDRLGGNWGPGAGKPAALVERIRDFLVKHGVRAGVPR